MYIYLEIAYIYLAIGGKPVLIIYCIRTEITIY